MQVCECAHTCAHAHTVGAHSPCTESSECEVVRTCVIPSQSSSRLGPACGRVTLGEGGLVPGLCGGWSGHSGVDGERGNHLALGPCQAEWPCPHHGCPWKPSGSLAWVSGWLLPHFISGAARPQVSGPRRCREGRPQDRDIGLSLQTAPPAVRAPPRSAAGRTPQQHGAASEIPAFYLSVCVWVEPAP